MFSRHALTIDAEEVAGEIEAAIREQVLGTLRRRGAVLGLSGGVDSSVVAALCARALGKERVLALFMPERECSGDALSLGRLVAEHLGIQAIEEPIGAVLEASGCYARHDAAIRMVFPEFVTGWRFKVTLPSATQGARLNVSTLTIELPGGGTRSARMPLDAYLQLVAAMNFKQRTRKTMEYYHADRLHYAVAGTPNRLEYDQGFFVKQGDGAADIKPIAHLYKTQVYQLARHLGVPEEVLRRPPTTDTYSMPQTQEEFYFGLPYEQMDLCLYGRNNGVPVAEVAAAAGLTPEQVERVYADIDQKRRSTRYLHARPLLAAPVPEVAG
ncbi:MAG TPA: NAD(+) synthase [Vicinamibacterales bacterium]|jgi:NAD+ synthase